MRAGWLALVVALSAGGCREQETPQFQPDPRWPAGPKLRSWSICETSDPPTARLLFESKGQLGVSVLAGVPVGARWMDAEARDAVVTREGALTRVDVRLTKNSNGDSTMVIVGMTQDDPDLADRWGSTVTVRFARHFKQDVHLAWESFRRSPLPEPERWCPPPPPRPQDGPQQGQQQDQQPGPRPAPSPIRPK